MKKVLVTGLNGKDKATAYVGSMNCFCRMRKNMDNHDGYSDLIDAIGRNFVDDESLSLTQFSSITSTPPDVMAEVSAILCMSCPEITREALSIAEHYGIPIVVASMGILFDGDKPRDGVSRANAEILLSISQKKAVFYCEEDKNLLEALRMITEVEMEAGLYDLNNRKLKTK